MTGARHDALPVECRYTLVPHSNSNSDSDSDSAKVIYSQNDTSRRFTM